MKLKFKRVGLTLMMVLMLVLSVPMAAFAASPDAGGGLTPDSSLGTGITADSAPPLLKNGTQVVGQLIQFAFWALAAWYSLRFLRDKAYGQFVGFIIFVIIIYIVIFKPDALNTLANSVSNMF